ncbi:hypothetical protein HMPREF1544_01793 [Mucor circinelloides 1006PhL]|uniref:BZIP domain-containing protein n=1 Tax=Mucor circinelloides f. circinelloides (strain 1006PhL) TaxID=1220926 RepID=S2JRZ6_MUCC1|nr:hypothetical protein HMPREF1544_01793 [Mucor circinelloides 1006PhL]
MYNPYTTSYNEYVSCQMLNPLNPDLSYPNPPPPPTHTVFTNYDYGYHQHHAASNRNMLSGQPNDNGNRNKRKMQDELASSSPLSSTSCSSSASFPDVNDRELSVKRSKKVTPKKSRRHSSTTTTTTATEDSESEAESRQRNLERNRLAASKCRQRKKEWIDELAHKAERMTRENEYLRQMLMQLKEETIYLKSQLIMHKNNDTITCQNKPFINLF